ncbi:hypothetical protein [Desulfobacter latus]|nr:hypothetical protein [Desulfobacter latus]
MSSDVKELINKYMPDSQMSRFGKIFTDTTEFVNYPSAEDRGA